MVRVHVSSVDFCIDSSEVTVAQYDEFFKSDEAKVHLDGCDWNISYLGTRDNQDLPVRQIDHCDARAFCAWAGKRLCAGINGSAIGDVDKPTENEWLFACTHGGLNTWPYGPTAVAGACSLLDTGDTVHPVKSFPNCEGGFRGLFDMVGNVWEWIDYCIPGDAGPDEDGCAFMGAAYVHSYDSVNCHYRSGFARHRASEQVGFRCCATTK